MINHLFKALFIAGGAVAAYMIANKVIKLRTGRSIPQHLTALWEDIRGKVLAWAVDNKSRLVGKITLRLAHVLDSAYIKSKKALPMAITAETKSSAQEVIMEREISASELADLMPELVGNQAIVLEV